MKFSQNQVNSSKGKIIKNLLQKTELIFKECSDKGKLSAFLILPEPKCAAEWFRKGPVGDPRRNL